VKIQGRARDSGVKKDFYPGGKEEKGYEMAERPGERPKPPAAYEQAVHCVTGGGP
jgi:hypothetical protein